MRRRAIRGPTASRDRRVMVVGAGWRFTSGISYYTCRLANAMAEQLPTSAMLIRQLVPTRFYPGGARVGIAVNSLQYAPAVKVFDGIDWYWIPSMVKALRFLRREEPTDVVLQWWTGAVAHSYLALAAAARVRGARVVIEWHEVQDTGEARIPGVTLYTRAVVKSLVRLAHGNLVHTQYDLELLDAAYGITAKPFELAAHGPYDHYTTSPSDGESRSSIPSDNFNILYFGIIRPYKGVEDLVAAFELLPEDVRNTMRLTLIGETWEGWTAPLEAVERSPYRDRITVVNRYVSDDEVATYFAAADAVALPYRRSSSSGPLHIAMSAGLPTVLTAVGGLVEAAGDYEGAVFVPPEDPKSLADALTKLPGMAGTTYADPHSWAATVAAFERLFEQIDLDGAGEPADRPQPVRDLA